MFTLRWIYYNYKTLGDSLQLYLLYYIAGSALLAWAFCYYHGPIKNERGLVIIIIQILSISMIYIGTAMKEISILCIIVILLVKYFGKYFGNNIVSNIFLLNVD